MSIIKDITSETEWEQHLASLPKETLLIVSFHAPWAAPCAQMSVALATLASEYPANEPLSTSWVAVNAEELSEISEQYDVTAVPFLILIRNGSVLDKISGSSVPKVRSAIEEHAKKPNTSPVANADLTTPSSAQDTLTETTSTEPQDPESQRKELFERLASLVKAAPVMLFMKGTPSAPQCGFSRQIVGILRDSSVKYGFFNILADDEVRQGLKEFADWPTYPQLWIDGELVGGLDIIKEEIAKDNDFFKAYSVSNNGAGIVPS